MLRGFATNRGNKRITAITTSTPNTNAKLRRVRISSTDQGSLAICLIRSQDGPARSRARDSNRARSTGQCRSRSL